MTTRTHFETSSQGPPLPVYSTYGIAHLTFGNVTVSILVEDIECHFLDEVGLIVSPHHSITIGIAIYILRQSQR